MNELLQDKSIGVRNSIQLAHWRTLTWGRITSGSISSAWQMQNNPRFWSGLKGTTRHSELDRTLPAAPSPIAMPIWPSFCSGLPDSSKE